MANITQTPTPRIVATALVALAVLAPAGLTAAEHQLGLGLHYWKSLDNLAKDFPGVDDSGVSWLASYLFDVEGPLKFAVDLEYFKNGYGGSTSSAWGPQVLALVGGSLYGGVGIGMVLSSSFDGNRSDPYFLARFGWDFPIFPHLTLDLNLNYQAEAFNQLDELKADALTLGAIVRYRFKSRD